MMSYKLKLIQQLQDTDKPTEGDFCIVMQARTPWAEIGRSV